MIKLFLYYLWVRLTERLHGAWLPSPQLAWEQARIANQYAVQISLIEANNADRAAQQSAQRTGLRAWFSKVFGWFARRYR